ncbi:MAG: triose-phosphate isomerase [Magnetococcales bacterium]|nr:triose-phosphate isomerase [Magnetococcales bacterium]
MRRALIVGNWKMNGLLEGALELGEGIQAGLAEREGRKVICEVVICPPFIALHPLNERLGGSSLKLGGQNMSAEGMGAHTGEISGLMLRNVGCRYVLLGHSERREMYGETDALVAKKTAVAFQDGLNPIVCLGEKEAERDGGQTLEVVAAQLEAVIPSLPEPLSQRQKLVVAYEPVWAIGTGRNATPEQAQEVHGFLRERLVDLLGEKVGNRIRLLYGGSMKPGNAAALLTQPDVDGGLIGGASLKVSDFLAIIDALPS